MLAARAASLNLINPVVARTTYRKRLVVKVRATPLGDGWVCGVEDLVERSLAFLLEREPLGSILRRFDLG